MQHIVLVKVGTKQNVYAFLVARIAPASGLNCLWAHSKSYARDFKCYGRDFYNHVE